MVKTLDDFNLKSKRVLIRTDLNLPMENGNISDLTRLIRAVETLRDCIAQGAKVILLSHFGRPKGIDPAFSQHFLCEPLSKALGQPVLWSADIIGDSVKAKIDQMKDGDVLLLENVRFDPREEKNDPAFTKALAELGDIYVNDAFSVSHRAHALTEGLAHNLPHAAGRLMQEELQALSQALQNPARPLAALVGELKISTKLSLLSNLMRKVDFLLIGGAMANTFLAAQGHNVGRSLLEADMLMTAQAILEQAASVNCQIILPIDVVVAAEFKAASVSKIVSCDKVPDDMMILDAGPLSVARMEDCLKKCHSLVWNGPLGAFELKPFDHATNQLARFVAAQVKNGSLKAVAGGGDTVSALANAGVSGQFTYVSTAGGAFLEWLEGKDLPGVIALS